MVMARPMLPTDGIMVTYLLMLLCTRNCVSQLLSPWEIGTYVSSSAAVHATW